VHCSALQCVAVRRSTMQSVEVCCSASTNYANQQHFSCNVLQSGAVCCSALHCIAVTTTTTHISRAVCCSVVLHVAMCCSALQCRHEPPQPQTLPVQCVAVWCCALQCVAVCCSVSQCVAVRTRTTSNNKTSLQCPTFNPHAITNSLPLMCVRVRA